MSIFKFGNISMVYLFALIPLLVLIFLMFLRWRNNILKKMGNPNTIKRLYPHFSITKLSIKFIIAIISISLLIVGLMQPQFGTKIETQKRKGSDIVIALDISNSMLAEDIMPNRLERAKLIIERIVEKLEGDRIGIVVFGGNAYTQLPITTDYYAAKLFLQNISTDIMPVQGTDIGKAIEHAMQSFNMQNKLRSKAIVIITDGEDHEAGVLEMADNARKEGVEIHTVGIGLEEGGPIPHFVNGRRSGYKRDREGNVIVTKLNEVMLQQIANTANGTYVRITNSNAGVNILLSQIEKMEKVDIESKVFSDYDDKYQYFVLLALCLILIEYLISERRSKMYKKLNLFKPYIMIGILFLSSTNFFGQSANKLIKEGNSEYKENKFNDAEIKYRKSLEKDSKNKAALFNLGNSMYKQQNYDEAIKIFENLSVEPSLDKPTKSKAYHNLGNSHLKKEQFKEAVKAYKNSLKINPEDNETKYNLSYALQKLIQQQQEQQQCNNPNNKDNKDQNKDKKDQNKQSDNKDNKDQKDKQDQENKQNQEKDKKNEQKDQNKGQEEQNKMSKEDAEKMLKAMEAQEKNVQDKLKEKKKVKGKVQIEKDW